MKRVQRPHAETGEIPHVARDDDQVMLERGRGDHRVLDEVIGTVVHEPRPTPKCRGVHYENIVGLGDAIEPSLDLGRLGSAIA